MTPLKAIRRHCLWCANDQAHEVGLCQSSGCSLHPYRFGKTGGINNPSPLSAIRKRCLDCVAGSYQDVASCTAAACALNRFRLGKNPNYGERKRTGAGAAIRRLREKLLDDDAIQRSKSQTR